MQMSVFYAIHCNVVLSSAALIYLFDIDVSYRRRKYRNFLHIGIKFLIDHLAEFSFIQCLTFVIRDLLWRLGRISSYHALAAWLKTDRSGDCWLSVALHTVGGASIGSTVENGQACRQELVKFSLKLSIKISLHFSTEKIS